MNEGYLRGKRPIRLKSDLANMDKFLFSFLGGGEGDISTGITIYNRQPIQPKHHQAVFCLRKLKLSSAFCLMLIRAIKFHHMHKFEESKTI